LIKHQMLKVVYEKLSLGVPFSMYF
jgi:hypothetical protein